MQHAQRPNAGAVLVTLSAIAALLLGTIIPMPGSAALNDLMDQGVKNSLLGFFNIALPKLAVVNLSAIGTLWLLWFLTGVALPVGASTRAVRWSRLVADMVFVTAGAVQGFGIANWAEALAEGALAGTRLELVIGPLWRLEAALTWSVGNALMVVLSRLITSRGIGQGPLVLAIVALVHGMLSDIVQIGLAVGRHEAAPVAAVLIVLAAVPLVAVIGALSLRRVAGEAFVFRSVRVTSSTDVVGVFSGLALLMTGILRGATRAVSVSLGVSPFVVASAFAVLGATAAMLLVGVLVWKRVQLEPTRPARRLLFVGFGVGALFCSIGLVVCAAIAAGHDAGYA